ncbi:hypothetical protein BKA80DRAFT_84122 [Phyllosticta citrichinensis]
MEMSTLKLFTTPRPACALSSFIFDRSGHATSYITKRSLEHRQKQALNPTFPPPLPCLSSTTLHLFLSKHKTASLWHLDELYDSAACAFNCLHPSFAPPLPSPQSLANLTHPSAPQSRRRSPSVSLTHPSHIDTRMCVYMYGSLRIKPCLDFCLLAFANAAPHV